jgi:hypothetical protein
MIQIIMYPEKWEFLLVGFAAPIKQYFMAACSPWAARESDSGGLRLFSPSCLHSPSSPPLVLVLLLLRGRWRLSLSPFWSSECSGVYREEQFAVVSTWDLFSHTYGCDCCCCCWCVVFRDIPLKRRPPLPPEAA